MVSVSFCTPRNTPANGWINRPGSALHIFSPTGTFAPSLVDFLKLDGKLSVLRICCERDTANECFENILHYPSRGYIATIGASGRSPAKTFVDDQAASPSSWKTPRMAVWMAA